MSGLMDAALLGMIAALLAAVLASVFDQRRESAKTRGAIQLLTAQVAGLATTSTAHSEQLGGLGDQVAGLSTQVAGLVATSTAHSEQLGGLGDQVAGLSTQVAGLVATSTAHSRQLDDLKEDHRTTQEQLGRINASLGNVRERLARIEGHLRIRGPDPDENEASP